MIIRISTSSTSSTFLPSNSSENFILTHQQMASISHNSPGSTAKSYSYSNSGVHTGKACYPVKKLPNPAVNARSSPANSLTDKPISKKMRIVEGIVRITPDGLHTEKLSDVVDLYSDEEMENVGSPKYDDDHSLSNASKHRKGSSASAAYNRFLLNRNLADSPNTSKEASPTAESSEDGIHLGDIPAPTIVISDGSTFPLPGQTITEAYEDKIHELEKENEGFEEANEVLKREKAILQHQLSETQVLLGCVGENSVREYHRRMKVQQELAAIKQIISEMEEGGERNL